MHRRSQRRSRLLCLASSNVASSDPTVVDGSGGIHCCCCAECTESKDSNTCDSTKGCVWISLPKDSACFAQSTPSLLLCPKPGPKSLRGSGEVSIAVSADCHLYEKVGGRASEDLCHRAPHCIFQSVVAPSTSPATAAVSPLAGARAHSLPLSHPSSCLPSVSVSPRFRHGLNIRADRCSNPTPHEDTGGCEVLHRRHESTATRLADIACLSLPVLQIAMCTARTPTRSAGANTASLRTTVATRLKRKAARSMAATGKVAPPCIAASFGATA
jgi:hypothetical protein